MYVRSSKGDGAQNSLVAMGTGIGEPLLAVRKTLQFPRKPKNPAAVALGKLGGIKGGRARAAKLTAQERKEIAQRAAKARWGKS